MDYIVITMNHVTFLHGYNTEHVILPTQSTAISNGRQTFFGHQLSLSLFLAWGYWV